MSHVTVIVHGVERRISSCDCLTCGNGFLIYYGVEFAPVYCPYCGIRFSGHEVEDGGADQQSEGSPPAG